jgi:hypothetical protein
MEESGLWECLRPTQTSTGRTCFWP